MKISNEIKVALLVIIAGALLYFGFNFIKGKNLFSSENTFIAVYDNINGLLPGNQVKLNGLKIGMIESCNFTDDGTNRVIVAMTIDGDVKIPRTALARIEAADLLGDMEINMDFGKVQMSDFANNLAQNYDTLQGELTMSVMESFTEELVPVKSKIEELMVSSDSLIALVNNILAAGQIESIMNSVDTTVSTLAKTSKKLDRLINAESQNVQNVIHSVANISSSLEGSVGQLNGILANADVFSKDLTDFSGELKQTDIAGLNNTVKTTLAKTEKTFDELNALLGNINESDGTVGQLLKDPGLYDNLEKSISSLDKLMIDLKENPKRYVQFSLIERKNKDKKNKDKDSGEENK